MLILNATHGPDVLIHNDVMKGMYVGASQESLIVKNKSYLLDSTRDNISSKNSNYCELTALYWLWKNNEDTIGGLNHYRRYLNIYKPIKKPFSRIKRDIFFSDLNSKKLRKLAKQDNYMKRVQCILSTYNVILPLKMDYSRKGKFPSLAEDYFFHHRKGDWDILVNVILEKYPTFKKSIDLYLYSNSFIYGMNMFIANNKWINQYCSWLFDILFEVEQRIKISDDLYQKRVFGFMSERLMTLYVMHHQFRIFETQVLQYKQPQK